MSMSYNLMVNMLASPALEETGHKSQQRNPARAFDAVFGAERQRYQSSSDRQIEQRDMKRTSAREEGLRRSERIENTSRKDVLNNERANRTDKKNSTADDEARLRRTENKKERESEISNKDVDNSNKDLELSEEQEKVLRKIAEKLNISLEELTNIIKLCNTLLQGLEEADVDLIAQKLAGLSETVQADRGQMLKELKTLLRELGEKMTVKVGHIDNSQKQADAVGRSPSEEAVQGQEAQAGKAAKGQENTTGTAVADAAEEGGEQGGAVSKEQVRTGNGEKASARQDSKAGDEQTGTKMSEHGGMRAEKTAEAGQQEAEEENAGSRQNEGWKDKIKVVTVRSENGSTDVKTTETNNINVIQASGDVKAVREEGKVHNVLHTTKDQILKQVVDKASVLITQDKAEMIVNLKPDNLGKLSLKVVTENGIVTAQIMAENQQVKQIIEANLNILKDSLEKQGLNVQQFSVSVGQDSWNRNFNHGAKESFNRNSNREGSQGISTGSFGYFEGQGSKTSLWPDSTINFTA